MNAPGVAPQRDPRLYAVLGLGVASVSVAAILIRLADAEPLTVAAYRMGIAALLVSGFAMARARSQFRRLTWEDGRWLALSGGLLAIHFAGFIGSLDLTSVASSVFLITTAPLFVAVGSHWGLRERVRPLVGGVVLLSLAGGAVLAGGDWRGGEQSLQGDGLALLGGLAAAGYLLVGRRVRRRMPLLPYISVVHIVAAVLLLSAALAAVSPLTGYPFSSYGWMTLVALIPQVIGHSSLNWALAHLNATVVSLSVRTEPLIATALAVPVLDEVPRWTVFPGGLLILVSVYLAVRVGAPSQRRSGAV